MLQKHVTRRVDRKKEKKKTAPTVPWKICGN